MTHPIPDVKGRLPDSLRQQFGALSKRHLHELDRRLCQLQQHFERGRDCWQRLEDAREVVQETIGHWRAT